MKFLGQKGVLAVSLLVVLCVSGCSSAINPFYNIHPQTTQSFKDKRPPRDNFFAEKGGFAKKKPVDPFQDTSSEAASFQQGLIGDIETPANTKQQTKPQADQNSQQNAAPLTTNAEAAPPATQNAPATALSNKTSDASDYLHDLHLQNNLIEQGSGANNYGYNFYDLADEIGAVQSKTMTPQVNPEHTIMQTAAPIKPLAIKAGTLSDLPTTNSPTAETQNTKMCKLNKNNLLSRHFAASSNKSSTNANGQITPQELQKAASDNYPELKDVPANPKTIKTS